MDLSKLMRVVKTEFFQSFGSLDASGPDLNKQGVCAHPK